MKLKIKVTIIYPDNPPTEQRNFLTRNEADSYEQQIEIDENCLNERLQNIIKAFNNFV